VYNPLAVEAPPDVAHPTTEKEATMRATRWAVSTTISFLALTMPLSAATRTKPAMKKPVEKTQTVDLTSVNKGALVDGFRVDAVYLNDADQPMGARMVHPGSGFTLDLLQIESVPQGFIWVNSFPTSDMGEPHTQEHLLLGKGNRGRAVASLETMSLTQSNAFTDQLRTCYNFNTTAGPAVFYRLLERQLDALLYPDYTDEEIRREVRNFGVTRDADGKLRLEEKGSVYNEMTSSSDNPFRRLFQAMGHLEYGTHHPLAYNAGGEPAGIRQMKPEDIRKFHRDHYYLANMGIIAALPKSMPVGDVLARTGAILNKLQAGKPTRAAMSVKDLPAPQMAPAGTIEVVEYPHKNAQQPSPIALIWPPVRNLDIREKLLLDLFLGNIAGDPTTNLYKRFIDSKTRDIDIGAKGVFAGSSEDQGQPLYIGFRDVAAANVSQAKLADIRQRVLDEINRVASFADNSPELRQFNDRVASRVTETHRDLSKFVNSPPGFGFRNTGSDWIDHLLTLERSGQFNRSVTMKPELAWISSQLSSGKNFWREMLPKWQITAAKPYITGAKPSPDLLAKDEAERQARNAAEAARLKAKYGVADEQAAIRRYQSDYDTQSARIDKEARKVAPPKFINSPPMTLDDQLDYKVTSLAGGVPMVASRFDNMTSATTGIALRPDVVTVDELPYLALLPALLTRVGVIDNGKPVSYEEMSERLRREILSLNATYSTNYRTGRAELVVRGSGNDLPESQRALDWMRLVLRSPDWRPENLARIRDVVDQSLSQLRNTMQGAEEGWVQNSSNAYRRQVSLLLLATDSFLTRAHNAHRLRWLLKEAAPADAPLLSDFLATLANAGAAPRSELKAMLGVMTAGSSGTAIPASLTSYVEAFNALPPSSRSVAVEAAKDLDQTLIDIPDGSLETDWAYLCNEIRADLATPPSQVLDQLQRMRQKIANPANARMFLIASTSTQNALADGIGKLIGSLDSAPVARVSYSTRPLIKERLRQRNPAAVDPVFVGLVAPNMKGGVFLNSAPGPTFADFSNKNLQLEYLASRIYAGGGAHGIFMKTIGAGLAYSNGLRGTVASGQMGYYAERTPELPQTLRFVVDELKKAPHDPLLVEYAIAQLFGENRAAAAYEVRGEAMAADLADGQSPDMVRKFRQSILEIRRMPDLSSELYKRMDVAYGKVLPGYNVKARDVPGGIFYVIGPDKQLDLYEQYLKSAEGPQTTLYKIYPRDYWMVR
jgi:Zn-dependent M16 (insulinase) family peptidase